jgi:hypothetical protein
MTRPFLIVTALTLSVFFAAAGAVQGMARTSSANTPRQARIEIRHQTRGCHSWALNGGAYRATVSARLPRGGFITVVNDDVMPHKLIQKSGPAVRYGGNRAMKHMGASLKVTFSKPGSYHFITKAGEDYMSGVKTVGEDNVLRLTVKVS